jgi:hypothetical protein
MNNEPKKEHNWLQKLVGEWTYESGTTMEPDKPDDKSVGIESVRSIGGLWTLAEGQGEMPGGGNMTSITTLGYDPQKNRFVGTVIISMMNYLWIYDGGTLDADEKMLTLEAEGPSMADDGKMAKYKDVLEFKSDDYRVMTSYVMKDDGQWEQFMKTDYRRRK